MTRRFPRAALVALLTLSPFALRAQVGRVSIEAPAAPSLQAPLPVFDLAVGAPLSPAASFAAPSLTGALSAPAALPAPRPVEAARTAAEPARVLAAIVPAGGVSRAAQNDDRFAVVRALARRTADLAVSPETVSRLYEGAPSAPDFESLSSARTPAPPSAWRPSSVLLKPAAAAVNAWRRARHRRLVDSLPPERRMTSEEFSMQDTLSRAHAALVSGGLQEALDVLAALYKGDSAAWYKKHPTYRPYQRQGHEYVRFIESSVKLAFERAHGRSRDEALVAEAREAERNGTLLGHSWRPTDIQERDSAHCAHHALYNAIQASVGFTRSVDVARFVQRARELMNVPAEAVTTARGGELKALERGLGLKLGLDVGEGMTPAGLRRWARVLGLGFESRPAPRGDAQWSALLDGRRETLVGLRVFHERFKATVEQSRERGHEYSPLHHEVYLLGAFDSASREVRLYMVQDSGTGATDFYTAEELTAAASDVQLMSAASPVALP